MPLKYLITGLLIILLANESMSNQSYLPAPDVHNNPYDSYQTNFDRYYSYPNNFDKYYSYPTDFDKYHPYQTDFDRKYYKIEDGVPFLKHDVFQIAGNIKESKMISCL